MSRPRDAQEVYYFQSGGPMPANTPETPTMTAEDVRGIEAFLADQRPTARCELRRRAAHRILATHHALAASQQEVVALREELARERGAK